MKRVLMLILMLITMSLSISFASGDDMILLMSGEEENPLDIEENVSFIDEYETYSLYSEVIKAGKEEKIHDGYSEYIVQNVRIKILDSKFKGEEFDVVYYLEDGVNTRLPLYHLLKVGDKVYVYGIYENESLDVVGISYYDKTIWIVILFLIFALLISLIGGKNGIKALIGLAITMMLIFGVLVPGILSGLNVILLTLGICSLVIIITFLIVSGFNKKTFVAIIGTIGGIFAAAIIGGLFGSLMRLTGINEHARMISVAISEEQEMISFTNIMLSAIMISAMGACMDVGMSISSALYEIKSKKPDITSKELIRSGMNIGKDVMGTMTNTLILAYVGSAMLCILLYNVNGFDLSYVLNAEDITDEVLKSLAGSIGLIATIPITAVLGGTIISASKNNNEKVIKKEEKVEIPVNYFNG